jgi:hypothetical protein
MQRFRVSLALLLPLMALASCDPSITQPIPSGWQSQIRGEGEYYELVGTLGAASQYGATVAQIALQGPASTRFTWRLSTGDCTVLGSAVGAVAAYPELETSSQGSSNAQAELNQMLDPEGRYAVVVRSADGAIAGCGNLERQVFS